MTKERIVNNQIADLVADVDRLKNKNEILKNALMQISEMSDCGSYGTAILRMKQIASDALIAELNRTQD